MNDRKFASEHTPGLSRDGCALEKSEAPWLHPIEEDADDAEDLGTRKLVERAEGAVVLRRAEHPVRQGRPRRPVRRQSRSRISEAQPERPRSDRHRRRSGDVGIEHDLPLPGRDAQWRAPLPARSGRPHPCRALDGLAIVGRRRSDGSTAVRADPHQARGARRCRDRGGAAAGARRLDHRRRRGQRPALSRRHRAEPRRNRARHADLSLVHLSDRAAGDAELCAPGTTACASGPASRRISRCRSPDRRSGLFISIERRSAPRSPNLQRPGTDVPRLPRCRSPGSPAGR